jgi:hypothetical protein
MTADGYQIVSSLMRLRLWVESKEYSGFEPYDLLNSPFLCERLAKTSPLNWLAIQIGKHTPTAYLRTLLRVPASTNPKAVGLFLSGYCDLASSGEETTKSVQNLKSRLCALRSPGEQFFCWGYDWDYVSLRGSSMRAFSPNAVATVFCAMALLEAGTIFGDREMIGMASSAAEFLVTRLNRPTDTPEHLCFSYTPENNTRIFNSSVLVGSLLARIGVLEKRPEYLKIARRSMRYLVDQQRSDGSWFYGANPKQHWIDGFHTGYNLCALLEYQEATGDNSFDSSLRRGYEFYKKRLITAGGAPKYYVDSLYPVDVHACAQAILVFCNFCKLDESATHSAQRVVRWTLGHLQSAEGWFYYQKHRFWTNRIPYMRWGQAWMFRALARFCKTIQGTQPEERGAACAIEAPQ